MGAAARVQHPPRERPPALPLLCDLLGPDGACSSGGLGYLMLALDCDCGVVGTVGVSACGSACGSAIFHAPPCLLRGAECG